VGRKLAPCPGFRYEPLRPRSAIRSSSRSSQFVHFGYAVLILDTTLLPRSHGSPDLANEKIDEQSHLHCEVSRWRIERVQRERRRMIVRKDAPECAGAAKAQKIKRYHAPSTPYERALAHPEVPAAVKQRLRGQYCPRHGTDWRGREHLRSRPR
jgi:hypothetical protein